MQDSYARSLSEDVGQLVVDRDLLDLRTLRPRKDCFAILREGRRMGSDSRFDKRIERIVDLHAKDRLVGVLSQ